MHVIQRRDSGLHFGWDVPASSSCLKGAMEARRLHQRPSTSASMVLVSSEGEVFATAFTSPFFMGKFPFP